jgi:hypothetical protein
MKEREGRRKNREGYSELLHDSKLEGSRREIGRGIELLDGCKAGELGGR